jgi:hypothetical protein
MKMAFLFLMIILGPAAPVRAVMTGPASPASLAFSASEAGGAAGDGARAGVVRIIPAARPSPYNRGNCFQWKKCLGETIGNMWVDSPDYCGPLGGKSWKGQDGRCIDLMDAPWEDDPRTMPAPPAR